MKHPNAVKLFGYSFNAIWKKKDGRELTRAYLALEYIGGGDLYYYVKVNLFSNEVCRFYYS